MDTKIVNLLNVLLRKEEYVTWGELTAATGLQERSVRYEIEKLKDLLSGIAGIRLIQDRRKGILLQGTRDEKITLVRALGGQVEQTYLTNEERVAITVVLLLQGDERLTQNRLMERFQISPTTVKKDRRTIEILLEEYRLTLQSDIRRGYYIDGPEQGKRNFLYQILSRYLEQVLFTDAVRYYAQVEDVMLDYLDRKAIRRIRKQLTELYEQHKVKASAMAFDQMSLLLRIQQIRIEQGKCIADLPGDSQYESLDEKLMEAIRDVIIGGPLLLPEPEWKYLADYIAAFTGREQRDFLRLPNWLEIQLDTIELVMEMEQYIGSGFLSNDNIRETLFNHMEVLIHRIKSDIRIHNPLTAVIKEKYAYVYDCCRHAVRPLEKKYKRKISDEEIAYLTIYFHAYLEEKEPLKVMVVCGQGLSTGHLLAENLKKIFSFRIIGVLSYVEANTINHLDVDLVISTIDVAGLAIPVVKVAPILTKGDIETINTCLEMQDTSARTSGRTNDEPVSRKGQETGGRSDGPVSWQDDELVSRLLSIAVECARDLDTDEYVKQVVKLLYDKKIISKRSFEQLMVKDVLTGDCIQLRQEVSTWKEAIRVSAAPLLQKGIIEQRYIDAMIHHVEEYGPYIVIAPHIALAHARPEDGVNAVGLSIATLKEAVPFGNETYDPVEMVVCLAAADNYSHLEILSNIAEIINNRSWVGALRDCAEPEAFLKLILQAEQEIKD